MPQVEIKLPKLHPKQQLAFDSEATDILFGGATRGGKSYFLRRALIVWCSQIPGLQCDIFRLHYDDVVANHMEGETSFPALLAEWVRAGLAKINEAEVMFWNDSRISLEHAGDVKAVMSKHQGIAKHVRCFEESTQLDVRLIKWLAGWVTMSEEMKSRVPAKWTGRFPKILHTTNPIGPSSPYYRREYVDPRKPLSIEIVGKWKRQYIPALVEDNPSEDAEETRARIAAIGDDAVADALLNANWNALVGDFFPEWNPNRHVVTDFWPPTHWFRFRTFDWGTAEPFAVYWWAVSDGEPFRDHNKKERWFPRGALVAYQEWYGCDELDPSKGNRMRNEDMAKGIIELSEFGHKQSITLTDSKPFQDMGGENIAMTFAKNGCPLHRADTTRVAGASQLRSRLIGVQLDTNSPERVAMIFFCECCKYAQDYMPAITRHPSEKKKEDYAEMGEATHSVDAIRYACMAHSVIKDRVEPIPQRIEKELAARRPTIKKITKGMGHAYFS